MSDKMEEKKNSPEVEEQQQEAPKSPTMAETEQPEIQNHEIKKKPEKIMASSFSIWPPSQRTRDAVLNRLIETLSSPSVLFKRYGTVPHDEASAVSRRIEEEAFSSAAAAASSADADGIKILQAYSKEISKRILDAVKSRSAASGSTPEGDDKAQSPDVDPIPVATSEDHSTVET